MPMANNLFSIQPNKNTIAFKLSILKVAFNCLSISQC